jgi:hypothetical protein
VKDEAGRDRIQVRKFASVTNAEIRGFAGSGGNLLLFLKRKGMEAPPLRPSCGSKVIDFAKSLPQVLDARRPTEFMLSPQDAFGNTFTSGGSPQVGAYLKRVGGDAYALVVFKDPVDVGTVALAPVAGAARTEVYVWREGTPFNAEQALPAEDDPALTLVEAEPMGPQWVRFGATPSAEGFVLLSSTQRPARTTAVLVRAVGPTPVKADWRPRLFMARLLADRLVFLPPAAAVEFRGEIASAERQGEAGWKVRTRVPVSDVLPVRAVLDLGGERTFDAVCLFNCATPSVAIEAFLGKAEAKPADAKDEDWVEIGRYAGKYDKKLRNLSASRHYHEKYVTFARPVTTRALRFRAESGYRLGKWGENSDDNTLVDMGDVRLVRRLDPLPDPGSPFLLRAVGVADGAVAGEWSGDAYDVPVCAGDAAGGLVAVRGDRLCRLVLDPASGRLAATDLNAMTFSNAVSIAASADRIAVGDNGRHAVFVFDTAGKLLHTVGDRGGWKRGPWDPNVIERPSGVAVAKDGSLWIAENWLAPRRVSRFSPEGKFVEEFFGPSMYGGGGYLDPNLKAFYYRSMEFELDWARGSSRLKNLNDRIYTEESPSMDPHSFAYTEIGRPLVAGGRRYILGQGVVCILDEGSAVWRAAAVFGMADRNRFLTEKPSWKAHWARENLAGKAFIWCDLNEDGAYQVEEVEVFTPATPKLFEGIAYGPDLSLWGAHMRLAPSRITARGVPVYRSSDIRPFDYERLAPHYARNYTTAGPRSAKPGYSGLKYVTRDGCLVQEGQPFVVQPDGTILGGAPGTNVADFIPPIRGAVLDCPWSFGGGAVTKSDVGEVAVINSFRGPWYVWAAKHGVIVGTFFTGKDGGWSGGDFLPARGTRVEGRKQDWEGWHADFVKGDDGKYYAQAGKGFHGISRIEGLDDIRMRSVPVKVSEENARQAVAMRAQAVAAREAAKPAEPDLPEL